MTNAQWARIVAATTFIMRDGDGVVDASKLAAKWKEQATTNLSDRKSKCFMALVEEIRDNNYDKPIAFSPRRRRRLSRFGQGSWRNPDNGRRHLKCQSPEYGVLPL